MAGSFERSDGVCGLTTVSRHYLAHLPLSLLFLLFSALLVYPFLSQLAGTLADRV